MYNQVIHDWMQKFRTLLTLEELRLEFDWNNQREVET